MLCIVGDETEIKFTERTQKTKWGKVQGNQEVFKEAQLRFGSLLANFCIFTEGGEFKVFTRYVRFSFNISTGHIGFRSG